MLARHQEDNCVTVVDDQQHWHTALLVDLSDRERTRRHTLVECHVVQAGFTLPGERKHLQVVCHNRLVHYHRTPICSEELQSSSLSHLLDYFVHPRCGASAITRALISIQDCQLPNWIVDVYYSARQSGNFCPAVFVRAHSLLINDAWLKQRRDLYNNQFNKTYNKGTQATK